MATDSIPSSILTYKYRLLPTKKQHAALDSILESQRTLYNCALEHRIGAYRRAKQHVTLYDQMKELTELRKDPEFAAVPAVLQRWTLRRLDDAYKSFFRRVQVKGEKAGFPRFRGKGRWVSFGFSEFKGIRISDRRLTIKGLPGGLRIHLHRPPPDGNPLCCTFTRDAKGWYVCLQYRVPNATLAITGRSVGVDVGLTHLATLSTGEQIPNPRTAQRAEKKLQRKQRALARCERNSRRRRKVRAALARAHMQIRNMRTTYLHQVSARLVRENDTIAVEKLNVRGLTSGMLAKSVNDAAWSRLRQMLAYKAEWAGRQLIGVQAAGTSQTCPECGAVRKKLLAERTHRCGCGCVMDRDHAAALVILRRAVVGPGSPNVTQ